MDSHAEETDTTTLSGGLEGLQPLGIDHIMNFHHLIPRLRQISEREGERGHLTVDLHDALPRTLYCSGGQRPSEKITGVLAKRMSRGKGGRRNGALGIPRLDGVQKCGEIADQDQQ